jgi:hypothetical protein
MGVAVSREYAGATVVGRHLYDGACLRHGGNPESSPLPVRMALI